MKKLNRIKYFLGLTVAILATVACKKSFLEKPPLSSVVDANFYKTDDQVLAATSLLYSQVWFDYNDKAMYNLVISGEVRLILRGMTGVMYYSILPAITERMEHHGVHFLML